MASSSFKSSTSRSSITPSDSGFSNRPRRSRSLSRLPPEADEFAYETPKSKFVNKTRGSGLFPEISLDDLADDLFYGRSGSEKLDDESSGSRIGRTSSRKCDTSRFSMDTEASRRRGRSVSKKGTSFGNGSENGNGKREMRRSVSVVRRRNNDLESDTKKSNVSSKLRNFDSFQQPSNNNKNGSRQLRRSVSVVRHRRDDLESDPEKSTGSSKLRNFDGGNYQSPSKNCENGSRQLRRSVSVVRHRRGDFESDSDTTCGSNKLKNSGSGIFHRPSIKQMNAPRVLRRTMSQKDLLQFSDNYSSHSSLTDDDRDFHSHKSGLEKTIKTVYSQEKAGHPTIEGDENVLYEAMRNEVRHAVHEIRTELEKAMVKAHPTTILCDDVSAKVSNVNAVAEIRRSYTTELEKSEKRKQELLAELEAEEQHGYELTSIVRELLPAPKQASPALKSRSRRRSNDKTRMSRCLTEEAERYFEDFLSNVEDTDISSFDGDKSDTSSIIGSGVKMKDSSVAYNAISEVQENLSNATSPAPETSVAYNTISEVREILANATSLSAETDGVFLPWLEWETSNDATPFPCKTKEENGRTGSITFSNLGSCSSECNGSSSAISNSVIANKLLLEDHSVQNSCSRVTTEERSSFDLNEYMELRHNEDLLFETLKQRWRIESGGLILCRKSSWRFF